MKITAEISDYSNPAQVPIRIHNAISSGKVELEVDGKRYVVSKSEIISAIHRCCLDCHGE